MKMRRTETLRILFWMLIAGMAPGAAGTAAGSEILFVDGTTVTGIVRALAPSRYIVQGKVKGELDAPEIAFEVGGHLIDRIDGRSELPEFDPGRRIVEQSKFERVLPSGDVEDWQSLTSINRSAKVITWTSWGVTEREIEAARRMKVLDEFGQELAHRIETRDDGDGRRVVIDLAVPLAPGDPLSLSVRRLKQSVVSRAGDLLTYTFNGDFGEETVLRRKVELPEGAEIVSIEPEPLHTFDHAGRPLIIWSRFYAPREVLPQTVTFRLP